MPRNNLKEKKDPVTAVTVGVHPKPVAPAAIAVKGLQQALLDGYTDIAAFARDFLDVNPYDKQSLFLNGSRDAVEANFVAGNRVGKSHIAGVILLWRAFYRYISTHTRPELESPHVSYKAVSTSLTHDQAKIAWNYARTFAESKRFKPFVDDIVHSPFPTMKLKVKNERGDWVITEVWSRSLAKNGLYLLGQSISFLLVDECAYIPKYKQIEDEVLRMRLADQGGSLFRISTPNGRNFFFETYQDGLKGDIRYFSSRARTTDNPYISRAFVDEMKQRMAPEYYAQNVLAEFVSLSDFFKLEAIQNLYKDVEYADKDGNPLEMQLPVLPVKGAKYVMGVDLGALRDPTVVIVWRIDQNPCETVYVGEMRNTSWRASRAFIAQLYGTYRPEITFADATGVGGPIVQQLVEEDGLSNVEAFVFSHSSKPDAMVRLQDAIQRKKFVFPFCNATKELVNQLSFYRLDDKDIAQDYPLALALTNLAFEKATRRVTHETEIFSDLAFIDVLHGGEAIGGSDVYGPGTLFTFDQATGLYLPGHIDGAGEDEYGIIL